MGFKLPTLFRSEKKKSREEANFLVDEEGTVTIFGLLMFVLMVGVGGIAIDIMRYETQRVQLQYTLDRAVLAAAAMNNELDPRDVVLDYMARSGLERYRIDVNFEDEESFRRVTATAEMDINTIFMDMFGVRALTSPAGGIAEERVQNTEISLVLDVSGSMRGAKIENLRSAGQDFVAALFESNDYDNDDMLTSISVVPYNGMVNAGSRIASVYDFDTSHDASHCAIFEASTGHFSNLSLNPNNPLRRMERFDYYNRGRNVFFDSAYCPEGDHLAIVPWSNSVSELQTMIGNLPADGWTAIDVGMRWGLALLDPSAQPALEGLSDIHEDFDGRPADHETADLSDRETVKYIILMTDGANTEQYDLRERFTGDSYVRYHADDDIYSTYVPELDEWWITEGTYANSTGYFQSSAYDPSESVPVPWEYFWTEYTARSIAGQLYYWPYYYRGVTETYWDIRSDSLELLSGDENIPNTNPYPPARAQDADANLLSLCQAARDAGIVIFTIAFDAPQRGVDAMRGCVGSGNESQFYNVADFDISSAFDSIAATINNLRLTQ